MHYKALCLHITLTYCLLMAINQGNNFYKKDSGKKLEGKPSKTQRIYRNKNIVKITLRCDIPQPKHSNRLTLPSPAPIDQVRTLLFQEKDTV